MRSAINLLGWIIAGLVLGLVLSQYLSGGMLMAFVQKLPGCW